MPSGLHDFLILRSLGAGTGGVCRLARRRADGKLYALKELEMPAEHSAASSVMQEIHILASLEHPYIVRYYDSFIEERKLFLVMEYATHGSLHSVLQIHQKSGQHIEESTLWKYTIQLLLGLHSIHRLRVLHRDVKPQNIFLGAHDTVKIGDFGVSRLLTGSADLATTVVGSPGYLAPELCTGEPYDDKADVWALGVTLIELCLLRHPFADAASQAALVMRIINGDPPPATSHYSGVLSRLLSTCMVKSTRHRPTAHQLLCVPVVRERAKQLGLDPLMPPSRFPEESSARKPMGSAASLGRLQLGGGGEGRGQYGAGGEGSWQPTPRDGGCLPGRACPNCACGGAANGVVGGGGRGQFLETGGGGGRGQYGETQALRHALRQAQLESEGETRRPRDGGGGSPPEQTGPQQRGLQPLSRRQMSGEAGGRGEGWQEVRGSGEGAGVSRSNRISSEAPVAVHRRASEGVAWELRPVCADKRKVASLRTWHSLLQPSEEEEPSASQAEAAETSGANHRSRHTSGEQWEARGESKSVSPTERHPHTPPNLWAKRCGGEATEQGGKKVLPERPERLQMHSLNHAANAEMKSPLDAFAAKHCPLRTRAMGDYPGGPNSEERGIPEHELDFVEGVSSPLSALIRHQFPAKGTERRTLFE